ncbi:hypothetical protein BJY52DRAFT_1227705 [Lactarius psammicola]|nr:hypothetical protein BJY52DRAFT_1227705 [Lactarius psammicola]
MCQVEVLIACPQGKQVSMTGSKSRTGTTLALDKLLKMILGREMWTIGHLIMCCGNEHVHNNPVAEVSNEALSYGTQQMAIKCGKSNGVSRDFSREDFNQVLNSQLDSLAISPQAKQSIIPALLGIAKLTKVQSQGTAKLTLLSPSSVPMPGPIDTNTEASYQMRQRSFSSNSRTNQWECVTPGVESPLNHDQVLAIHANGEPSWITRASTITTKTRKEKEIREKLVPG